MNREYKQSGIELVGDIPRDWEVLKMRNIGVFSSSGIDKKVNEDEELVKIVNYVDVYRNIEMLLNNKDYMVVSTTSEKIKKHSLNEGDLIFTPSSETIDDIGVSALVNENLNNTAFSYHVLRFKFNKQVFKSYKKYLCNNYYVQKYFSSRATGSIRKTLKRTDFNELKVVLPPVEKQKKIANYLDKKVSGINDIISKTKISIEEYKKYKYALITETVTKGLNSNIKMKESNIAWVKMIPEDWKVFNLNQLYVQVKNKNKELFEKNLLSLSYGQIIQKDINKKDGLLPENFQGYNIVNNGDIILRLTDLQNDHKSLRVGLCTQTGIITSAYISLRKKSEINDRYAYYYFHSFDIYKGFYGMGSGVRQGLTFEGIKYLKILCPNLKEQIEIVNYLDNKCIEIDNIIEKKQILLVEMEAYKKSLIYECVTGKREVN